MIYPISGGRIINVAAVVHDDGQEGTIYEGPWTSTVEGGEWVRRFSGWEPNVQEITKVGVFTPKS